MNLRASLDGKQIVVDERARKLANFENEDFSEREKMAFRFAERFVIDPHSIDDDFFRQLEQHFTEAEIVELGWATGSFFFRGRLNIAFGLE